MNNLQAQSLQQLFFDCGNSLTGPIKTGKYDQIDYIFVTNGLRKFRIDGYGGIEEKEWNSYERV